MGDGTEQTVNKVPKIYAHRGASRDFPEHTREAYEAAIEQNADGFECDVRLTKDGVAIVWHDADMSRITNSKFLGTIADLTFDEIRLHYSKVMKLTELVELAIKHRKDLAIETKHPVPSGHAVESEVARILNSNSADILSAGIEISLMSFSWFALEFFTRLNVNVAVNTVMLLNRSTARLFRRFTSAKSLGPGFAFYKESIKSFQSAQSDGLKVFVWTVDQPEEMKLCWASGIDVLITNKPELARKVLGYP
jgi:glycerophosphoryl diester phosphodiesterase